jgi:hypothetical protein
MLQMKACRSTHPVQYYSHDFTNAAMWKNNILEDISLLFEDLEILALGIQMLN